MSVQVIERKPTARAFGRRRTLTRKPHSPRLSHRPHAPKVERKDEYTEAPPLVSEKAVIESVRGAIAFVSVYPEGGERLEFAIDVGNNNEGLGEGDFCYYEVFLEGSQVKHRLRKVSKPQISDKDVQQIETEVMKLFEGREL